MALSEKKKSCAFKNFVNLFLIRKKNYNQFVKLEWIIFRTIWQSFVTSSIILKSLTMNTSYFFVLHILLDSLN